ncbi:hypothetical protein AWI43_30965 [Streptomyces sp. WAC04657]|nr:hypothetical protein AWI43_30965 [Streptomyces sp. WAC04657]
MVGVGDVVQHDQPPHCPRAGRDRPRLEPRQEKGGILSVVLSDARETEGAGGLGVGGQDTGAVGGRSPHHHIHLTFGDLGTSVMGGDLGLADPAQSRQHPPRITRLGFALAGAVVLARV